MTGWCNLGKEGTWSSDMSVVRLPRTTAGERSQARMEGLFPRREGRRGLLSEAGGHLPLQPAPGLTSNRDPEAQRGKLPHLGGTWGEFLPVGGPPHSEQTVSPESNLAARAHRRAPDFPQNLQTSVSTYSI